MMPEPLLIYPSPPELADPRITRPSRRFNSQVISMLNAIAIFFLTYLLLLTAAIAIAAAMIFAGYQIIRIQANFLTLALGFGFAASGLMLIYFLIKFLFKKSTPEDQSNLIEITSADEPALFSFLAKTVQETKVTFPKHVYISCDVNAGVFFDSSFWSMFLPVKKNLKIGLGMVNVLNQSEFKAVLAHEFGHFSQGSMKFGSYVYNLNKVIHNLLFDNENYVQTLDAFSRMHIAVRLGFYINLQLIKAIQFLLRKVYILLNKKHMGLSREMEFHADTIAASVSGSNNVINVLRRTEIADSCYTNLLNYWDSKVAQKQRPDNLYEQHLQAMKYFAEDHRLKSDTAGVPFADKPLAVLNNNRVSINNQWASHPTVTEREVHLAKLSIPAQTVTESAWKLFSDPAKLQRLATNLLYAEVKDAEIFELVTFEQFKDTFDAQRKANSYNAYYKGYYDSRIIKIQNLDPKPLAYKIDASYIERLFSDENCNLPCLISGILQDIELLEYASGNKDIITFYYEEKEYSVDKINTIKTVLENKLETVRDDLAELDQEIYASFRYLADNQPQTQLKEKYKLLLDFQPMVETDYQLYGLVMQQITPIYNKMPLADIDQVLEVVYATEKKIKNRIQDILDDHLFNNYLLTEQRAVLEKYVAEDRKYFVTRYSETNLAIFNEAMSVYYDVFSSYHYKIKNDLLNYQLTLLS